MYEQEGDGEGGGTADISWIELCSLYILPLRGTVEMEGKEMMMGERKDEMNWWCARRKVLGRQNDEIGPAGTGKEERITTHGDMSHMKYISHMLHACLFCQCVWRNYAQLHHPHSFRMSSFFLLSFLTCSSSPCLVFLGPPLQSCTLDVALIAIPCMIT